MCRRLSLPARPRRTGQAVGVAVAVAGVPVATGTEVLLGTEVAVAGVPVCVAPVAAEATVVADATV